MRNSYILTVGDKVTLKADNDANWTGVESVAIADDTALLPTTQFVCMTLPAVSFIMRPNHFTTNDIPR